MHAPCIRMSTMLSGAGVSSTNSISPPSAWTAGRMRSMIFATRWARGESDLGICPEGVGRGEGWETFAGVG